jgi:hypothetical protein
MDASSFAPTIAPPRCEVNLISHYVVRVLRQRVYEGVVPGAILLRLNRRAADN